ncbi:uncharacterized protein HKW66_Vig0232010 [Vigna angularis]|uniref:Uncharacterized protein n=1 Tax=Phaseolus angularis TaxID=3914 RepID=A0A8T0KFL5_PHAAN|nr:uncharacterized protein HKW66_Vig0232010 [Vigna angularis]
MIMELPDSTDGDDNLNAPQPQHNNHRQDGRSGLGIDLNEIPSPSAETLPDSVIDVVLTYDENPGSPSGAPGGQELFGRGRVLEVDKGQGRIVLQTKVAIIVTKENREGMKILATVRELGASMLVVGLHDHSFLYRVLNIDDDIPVFMNDINDDDNFV